MWCTSLRSPTSSRISRRLLSKWTRYFRQFPRRTSEHCSRSGWLSAVFLKEGNLFVFYSISRYHNREAVIISALQVEKHPLTQPGPYATPPMAQRQLLQNGNMTGMGIDYSSMLQSTISRGSPIIGRAPSGSIYNGSPKIDGFSSNQSPKPHSSPKMKLRFLMPPKFIFFCV